MGHGHVVIANQTCSGHVHGGVEVARKLLPEEVEINPRICATPRLASEWVAAKSACLIGVSGVEGKVKNGHLANLYSRNLTNR